jgi:hypothetical protein
MPSSTFLRSRWLLYLMMAIALGSVSPAVTDLLDFTEPATRDGLLYWWFLALPAQFDAALRPAVFALQYLAVFGTGPALVKLVQWVTVVPKPAAPPDQQRAFDTAAALYHLRDGW